MRLLVVVFAVIFAVSGVVLAKELKVTNSADFVNCAAGVALTAGPDAGQTALAGDTCVVMPGAYAATVTVTLQNLKIFANVGASLERADRHPSQWGAGWCCGAGLYDQ